MDYKDIVKQMKQGDFKNVYLFYGKEFYLIENVVNICKSALNPSMLSFNLEILDGKELSVDEIKNSTETLPFMDERKIVIIKDLELIKGKKKSSSESEEKELANYLENIPSTTVVVFLVYGDLDKRKSIIKKIEKQGIVYNCDKLSDMEVFKWIKNEFRKREVNIADSTVMYFIEKEDYKSKNNDKTLSDLKNEIEKIASFSGKGNEVNKEVIDLLSQKKVENDVFKLIDHIGNKNVSHAMKILNDMILEGESVLGIFAMISRQFKLVIQSKTLQEQGYTTKVIAEKLSSHPFVITKAIKQSQKFSNETIVSLLNDILQNDYKIKNGLIKDTLAIEILISKHCQ